MLWGWGKSFYATSVLYEHGYGVAYNVPSNVFCQVTLWHFIRFSEKQLIILVRWNASTKAMKRRKRQLSGIGKILGYLLSENSQATCTYKMTERSAENGLLCFWK